MPKTIILVKNNQEDKQIKTKKNWKIINGFIVQLVLNKNISMKWLPKELGHFPFFKFFFEKKIMVTFFKREIR